MPEQFLHLQADTRREVLETAAMDLGRDAKVLEKDIWVCWALQALFSMPNALSMAFKGGTSLSKVYNAIKRFSEDVDVTFDYRNFDSDIDPFACGVSKNAIKRHRKLLENGVRKYVKDIIVPYIDTQLQALPEPKEYGIKVSDKGDEIRVNYPSAIETTGSGSEYLKDNILIEVGGRNVIEPNKQHTVKPDILESASLVADLNFPSAEVVVLSLERTFWEKATLIHVVCNCKKIKSDMNHLSRHWYDLCMLADHNYGKAAINDRKLFEDVVQHKQVFFSASDANYEACLDNKLCLIPNNNVVDELRKDYENMVNAGMIYGEPPSFDKIIAGIRKIERKVNL